MAKGVARGRVEGWGGGPVWEGGWGCRPKISSELTHELGSNPSFSQLFGNEAFSPTPPWVYRAHAFRVLNISNENAVRKSRFQKV